MVSVMKHQSSSAFEARRPVNERGAVPWASGSGHDGAMGDALQTYLGAIAPSVRPLFDRIDALIYELHPDVEVVISYDMPTYVVGDRRLHVAAWKSWVSLYGWDEANDGGIVARFPKASSGRGTLKISPADAASITDDELRALLRGALDRRSG